jgi:hypothetical protein
MTTAAPFLQRHLGDYLLVAQLSEDPLGTVFRALYAVDERRFVRLRVLRSESLLPEPIDEVIRRNGASLGRLVHGAVVARPQLDSVDGIPFMTWDETAGWTLDTMFARVRAFGIRIPAEYALLIAERIAAALEHAEQAGGSGSEGRHGLLWPGFVTISHDAAVRVGGFGVADGVRPSLSRGKIAVEIAPYVAPEARLGEPNASSDVYSLGAILVELLTARRPAPEGPSAELRAADPRSEELGNFLQRCLAPAGERFATPTEAHRALQRIVTGNPFSLYTANLSLFLYKLLNPESQSVAPLGDHDSTNPVVVARRSGNTAPAPAAHAPSPDADARSESTPQRRADDFADVDQAIDALEPTAVTHRSERIKLVFASAAEAAPIAEALAAGASLPTPSPAPASVTEPEPSDGAFAKAESRIEKMSLWKDPNAVAEAVESPPRADAPPPPREPGAPLEVVERATRLLEGRRMPAMSTAWQRPAAALAAAAGLTVGIFLVASRVSPPKPGESAPAAPAAARAISRPADAESLAVPASMPPPSFAVVEASRVPAAAPASISFADVVAGPAPAVRLAALRRARAVDPGLRRPTEELRLRAALARIDADRVNAREAASDIFGEGRSSEAEGERLLRAQEYESAQLAFSRAQQLFQKAQELSWEERVRKTSLGGGGEGTVTK